MKTTMPKPQSQPAAPEQTPAPKKYKWEAKFTEQPYPFTEAEPDTSLLHSEYGKSLPYSAHLRIDVVDDIARGVWEKVQSLKKEFVASEGKQEPTVWEYMAKNRDAHICKSARIRLVTQMNSGFSTEDEPQDWAAKPVFIPSETYRKCILGRDDFRVFMRDDKFYLKAVRGAMRKDNPLIPEVEIIVTENEQPNKSEIDAANSEGRFPIWVVKCEESVAGYKGNHRDWNEALFWVCKDKLPNAHISHHQSANLIHGGDPKFSDDYRTATHY